MGTLFAIENALTHPTVKGLVLLNTPLKVCIRWAAVKNSLGRRKQGIESTSPCFEDKCGVMLTRNPFLYALWIPNYLALFRETRAVRRILSKLNTPALAFHSRRDELVSAKSVLYLSEAASVEISELADSSHFLYSDNAATLIRRETLNIL